MAVEVVSAAVVVAASVVVVAVTAAVDVERIMGQSARVIRVEDWVWHQDLWWLVAEDLSVI